MNTCYYDRDSNSIADLVAPNELTPFWTITRINVPVANRGKGYGADLLARIIADADEEGVILALEVAPSDGLDRNQLTAWYERAGFRMSRMGYYMMRPCKVSA